MKLLISTERIILINIIPVSLILLKNFYLNQKNYVGSSVFRIVEDLEFL